MLNEAMAAAPSGSALDTEDDDSVIAVERATCRLHEALCLFKDGRPGDCVEVCTDVLGDRAAAVRSNNTPPRYGQGCTTAARRRGWPWTTRTAR